MKRYFLYLYFGVFILLSIPMLKFAGLRYGQLFIFVTFVFVFIDDYNQKKVDWFILGYFFIGGVLLSLISLNSIEGKIGEIKYIIKYLFIFPLSFYIGAKIIEKISIKDFIYLLEISVFIYFLVAYLVNIDMFPSSLIKYRTDGFGGQLYVEFQGTFDEAGTLGMVSYLFSLVSFLLRYEFKIYPKKKFWLYIFYIAIFISLVLTRNKTIWISLLLVLLILAILKIVFTIYYANIYQPVSQREQNKVLKLFKQVNATKLLAVTILAIISLYVINELLPEPLITLKMIKLKLAKERGKAFEIALKLLADNNFLGAYGFGFIEYYFSNLTTSVIGLGRGVGMIFNSFLDVWLSVGIAGVLFHLGLFFMSFSKEYFLTIIIPITLFIYNNFNPYFGYEYHYIFLGLSYGFVQKYVKKRVEYI